MEVSLLTTLEAQGCTQNASPNCPPLPAEGCPESRNAPQTPGCTMNGLSWLPPMGGGGSWARDQEDTRPMLERAPAQLAECGLTQNCPYAAAAGTRAGLRASSRDTQGCQLPEITWASLGNVSCGKWEGVISAEPRTRRSFSVLCCHHPYSPWNLTPGPEFPPDA